MAPTHSELVHEGVEALLRGDLQRLEELLAPDVEWGWFEPGGEDLVGREAVLGAFRERVDEGVLGGLLEVVDLGDDVVVGIAPSPRAAETGAPVGWTRVAYLDGLVARLVSYDSRERALAS
jgi:hypothetical protein